MPKRVFRRNLFIVSSAACVIAATAGVFLLAHLWTQNTARLSPKGASSASSASSVPSVTPAVVASGKIAYLTFDDGPSKFTPHLLDVLKQNGVKATFFIAFMGEDTPQKRAWIAQEADDGNALGVHSWTHKYNYIYANEQNFLTDFNTMKNILVSATGVEPKVCRFPGGIGNTISLRASHGQVIMPKLVADVEAMGITPFDWNAGGEDADLPYPTTPVLEQKILADCKGQDNVVILMHDTHEFSIDAVPFIIGQLKAQGYTFETLSPQAKTVQEPFAKLKDSKNGKIRN